MKIRKTVSTIFMRSNRNPIIKPRHENSWECFQTFNPGAALLDGEIHFLYRAIGVDEISRLGYARSRDGFHVDERLHYPVYEHKTELSYICFSPSGGGLGGVEDPRIVRVDKELSLYVTYTAFSNWNIRMALTSISVDDFPCKNWKWKPQVFMSPPGEIHKNWVIFPEKIHGKYAILYRVSPSISYILLENLEFKEPVKVYDQYSGAPGNNLKGGWEGFIKGAGPPPLKTKYGWLIFYHALSKCDITRYRVGAMLLDLEEPTKMLYHAREPVLEPTTSYENSGFKPGVVYVTGAVVKDGLLIVYYGASDSYVCAAYAELNEFLEILKGESE